MQPVVERVEKAAKATVEKAVRATKPQKPWLQVEPGTPVSP